MGGRSSTALVEHHQLRRRAAASLPPSRFLPRLSRPDPPLPGSVEVHHHRADRPPDEEVQEQQEDDLQNREDERRHVQVLLNSSTVRPMVMRSPFSSVASETGLSLTSVPLVDPRSTSTKSSPRR